ncbi:MAG: hypothetical protein ACYCPP_01855, partial [Nitrososphaerales archaeon]
MKISGSSGIAKKALLLLVIIIAGGVVVGLFDNSHSAQMNNSLAPTAGASFGAALPSAVSTPFDSSFGVGHASSATTIVNGGATVLTTVTMAATSSATQPDTTVVKPNSPG